MATVQIAERAVFEIREIREYSREMWGERRAAKYSSDMNKTLELLAGQPGLMQSKPEISDQFRFYVSGGHILVFKQMGGTIYLATVMHSKMAWGRRVKELQPVLMKEIERLHAKVAQSP